MILLFPGDCDKEEEDNLSEKEDSTASGMEGEKNEEDELDKGKLDISSIFCWSFSPALVFSTAMGKYWQSWHTLRIALLE